MALASVLSALLKATQRVLPGKTLQVTTTQALSTMVKDGHLEEMTSSGSPPSQTKELNIADILYGVHCKHLFLIDIREPKELSETGKIGRALNIPADEIEKAFSLSYGDFEAKYHVPKPNFLSERVVIYGRSADMSKEACEKLRKMGYDKIKNYPGGIMEWNNVILADVKALEDQDRAPSVGKPHLVY